MGHSIFLFLVLHVCPNASNKLVKNVLIKVSAMPESYFMFLIYTTIKKTHIIIRINRNILSKAKKTWPPELPPKSFRKLFCKGDVLLVSLRQLSGDLESLTFPFIRSYYFFVYMKIVLYFCTYWPCMSPDMEQSWCSRSWWFKDNKWHSDETMT